MLVEANHPNIRKLIIALQKEFVNNDAKINEAIAGTSPPSKRACYRNLDARIERLVIEYDVLPIEKRSALVLEFLSGIAANIPF